MFVGDKFYRYSDHELEMVRISKLKKSSVFFIHENGERYRMPSDEFSKEFIKLNPHGMMTFNLVKLGTDNDVIVTLYRQIDIEEKSNIPFAVCRQNILDFFTDTVEKLRRRTDKIPLYLGVSVNQLNAPEDIPIQTILACDGVDYSECVSVYRDDTIDDVLRLVSGKTIFDTHLSDMKNKLTNSKDDEIMGLSPNLGSLLYINDMQYDFDVAMNIINTKLDITYDMDTNLLDLSLAPIISSYLNHHIINPIVMEYDYMINEEDIKRDFVYLRDKHGKLFIMVYTKGKVIVNNMNTAAYYKPDKNFNINIR